MNTSDRIGSDPLANDPLDGKLRAALLLSPRKEGDRLVLADAILRAALDGTRHLTPAESAALQASPLTLRRLRTLSEEARQAEHAAASRPTITDTPRHGHWSGSGGMLRAAAGQAPLVELVTDDGWWRLHFIDDDGAWRVIVSLDAGAPFAAHLLRERALLRVLDGAGAAVLHGRLDADGEYETHWPFALAPAAHFQSFGARFAVEPAPSLPSA